MKLLKKGETNMAYPFKPLSTEKLKIYFDKMIESNRRAQETNLCRKKHSGKKTGNKLKRSIRIPEAWIQRRINS